jgi:proliferating cell nuclear antigen
MNITQAAFESYSAEETEIGLDLDKVKGVLKLAGSGEIIKMEQDDATGKLIFKVGNITRRMSLIDTTGMNDPKVPQLNLTANIAVPIEELQKGIRAVESISDHITLKAGPEFFELSCEGDTDSVSLKLDSSAAKIDTETNVCSMFPPEYMANIIKAIPAGTEVNIELDNDYPVKFVFSLANGAVNVDYLLAPRIESE